MWYPPKSKLFLRGRGREKQAVFGGGIVGMQESLENNKTYNHLIKSEKIAYSNAENVLHKKIGINVLTARLLRSLIFAQFR